MVVADSELDGWRTDTDPDIPNFAPDSFMHTDSASPIRGGDDVWFGVGENDTNDTNTDHTFGGAMNGVMMEAANSPTTDSREQRCFNEHIF
jgi:hypothetical protein